MNKKCHNLWAPRKLHNNFFCLNDPPDSYIYIVQCKHSHCWEKKFHYNFQTIYGNITPARATFNELSAPLYYTLFDFWVLIWNFTRNAKDCCKIYLTLLWKHSKQHRNFPIFRIQIPNDIFSQMTKARIVDWYSPT